MAVKLALASHVKNEKKPLKQLRETISRLEGEKRKLDADNKKMLLAQQQKQKQEGARVSSTSVYFCLSAVVSRLFLF